MTDTSGPFFDGRAAQAVTAFLDDAEREVADEGVNLVRARLASVIRENTGYYESHIQTDRASDGERIWDGGVVYGPWLEGTGSRNRTTRFKGYRTFRLVREQLATRVPEIAERTLRRYLGRMQ